MRTISVIVRTKDEESWIGLCLRAIRSQEITAKIEIVLVDSGSSDRTVDKALAIDPSVVVVRIDDFRPGMALNRGIARASGETLILLSSHCIPASRGWLQALIEPLERAEVAGVYGRQIPLPSTDPADKRDLWITFGLDPRDQRRDPFFHNANSAIRRADWEKLPFDEDVSNLEDRVWAAKMLDGSRVIHYTPDAVVYHHHGIHQSGTRKRAEGVVRVMETMHGDDARYVGFDNPLDGLTRLLLIPLSPRYGHADEEALWQKRALLAKIGGEWDLIALPSNDAQRMACSNLGIEVLDVRRYGPHDIVAPLAVDIQKAIEALDDCHRFYDFVAVADVRSAVADLPLMDRLLMQIWNTGADSAVSGHREVRPILRPIAPDNELVTEVLVPGRKWMEATDAGSAAMYIADPARLIISRPEVFRGGRLLGDRVSIVVEELGGT
jgi:glycosyltransferase involved in cell wall biosynthesis